MKDRVALLLYLAALVAASLIHDPLWLGGGLLVVLALAGRAAPRVLRRAVLAVLVFSSMVSVSYWIIAWVRGESPYEYLLLLNLRVLLMTSMSFLVIERVDLLRALSFSKTLVYVVTLASSQLLAFRRLYHEMGLALRSRSLGRLRVRDLYRHAAASGSFFIEKALADASEMAQGMTSRGFFDDSP